MDSSDLTQVPTETLDPRELQERLSTQTSLMAHKDKALEEARSSLSEVEKEVSAWQQQHKETHRRLVKEQSYVSVLKRQLSSMQSELDRVEELKEDVVKMRTRLSTLEGVEKILKGSVEEMENLVASHKTTSSLATFVVALKRDYDAIKDKRLTLIKDISHYKKQLQNKDRELQNCQTQRSLLEIDLKNVEEEKKTLQRKVGLLQAAIDSPGSRCALKRILESPMPTNGKDLKAPDLGSSPLLTHTRSLAPSLPTDVTGTSNTSTNTAKTRNPVKRPLGDSSRPADNIIMPVSKVQKLGKGMYMPKTLSSHVLKKGLKFAPKKNLSSLGNVVSSRGNKLF